MSCPICFEDYDEKERLPRVFECGHDTCEACIKELYKHNSNKSMNCPKCRKVCNTNPKNLTIVYSLIKDTKQQKKSHSTKQIPKTCQKRGCDKRTTMYCEHCGRALCAEHYKSDKLTVENLAKDTISSASSALNEIDKCIRHFGISDATLMSNAQQQLVAVKMEFSLVSRRTKAAEIFCESITKEEDRLLLKPYLQLTDNVISGFFSQFESLSKLQTSVNENFNKLNKIVIKSKTDVNQLLKQLKSSLQDGSDSSVIWSRHRQLELALQEMDTTETEHLVKLCNELQVSTDEFDSKIKFHWKQYFEKVRSLCHERCKAIIENMEKRKIMLNRISEEEVEKQSKRLSECRETFEFVENTNEHLKNVSRWSKKRGDAGSVPETSDRTTILINKILEILSNQNDLLDTKQKNLACRLKAESNKLVFYKDSLIGLLQKAVGSNVDINWKGILEVEQFLSKSRIEFDSLVLSDETSELNFDRLASDLKLRLKDLKKIASSTTEIPFLSSSTSFTALLKIQPCDITICECASQYRLLNERVVLAGSSGDAVVTPCLILTSGLNIRYLDLQGKEFAKAILTISAGLSPIVFSLVFWKSHQTIFYSDSRNGIVWESDLSGNSVGSIGQEVLKSPRGLHIHDDKQLFVCDSSQHNVTNIDLDKREVMFVINSESLTAPLCCSVTHGTMELWVTNLEQSGFASVFDASTGTYICKMPSDFDDTKHELHYPWSLVHDPHDDRCFLTSDHKVTELCPQGCVIATFGSDIPGNGGTDFNDARGLCLFRTDAAISLFVCDRSNQRLHIFTSDSNKQTSL